MNVSWVKRPCVDVVVLERLEQVPPRLLRAQGGTLLMALGQGTTGRCSVSGAPQTPAFPARDVHDPSPLQHVLGQAAVLPESALVSPSLIRHARLRVPSVPRHSPYQRQVRSPIAEHAELLRLGLKGF
jgi:hypothetical protein